MEKRIGFIGCGKMAQAMITGMLNSNLVSPSQIAATANTEETIEDVASRYGITVTEDNKWVAETSDYLFIAVKPDVYKGVIQEIKSSINEDVIIITIAAGMPLDKMKKAFEQPVKVIRSMPNTPSLLGEGMSVLCPNDLVQEDELADVMELFNSFGQSELIKESLMDAIPAISGSSPAYVYMFIEAMSDAAVRQGIPRDKAYKLASQAVYGAAKMVLETGEHPGALKDAVCTPGGPTIEAVATLEESNFRSSVMKAMQACTDKSKQLSDN
ncbi:pyrroline-5-carboxylate reductase [Thalassobacillus sp. CUG 92003]|uniref:pyrroline-5-carboxylate reductase n=1 Tax=Thalassobacillus sp. CUG 92003 TaxID=2736641 RepID=UPI0015E710C3|nr:pyrroline-5-carboxylate reductase [Thalassobacillus sp. CUG 92003]